MVNFSYDNEYLCFNIFGFKVKQKIYWFLTFYLKFVVFLLSLHSNHWEQKLRKYSKFSLGNILRFESNFTEFLGFFQRNRTNKPNVLRSTSIFYFNDIFVFKLLNNNNLYPTTRNEVTSARRLISITHPLPVSALFTFAVLKL